MSKEDIHKRIDDGSYIAVPKWFAYLRNIINPIVLISAIYTLGSWKADIDTKLFSSPEERARVIQFVELDHPVNTAEEARFENHLGNIDIHRPTMGDINMFIPRAELEAMLIGIKTELKNTNRLLENLQNTRQ